MTLNQRKLCRTDQGGFSLVEVALAVAIAALAIITLLGLLPQGLEISRKTSIATANSAILEQIIRGIDNAKWVSMPTSGNPVRKYYTDQGIEVESGSSEISFVAEIEYQDTTTLPLPVSSSSSSSSNYLRRVIVKVATSSDTSFKFGADNQSTYVVFNHLVAKTR